MTNNHITEKIIDQFDALVAAIPLEQYAEICEELAGTFDTRLEAANEDLKNQGEES